MKNRFYYSINLIIDFTNKNRFNIFIFFTYIIICFFITYPFGLHINDGLHPYSFNNSYDIDYNFLLELFNPLTHLFSIFFSAIFNDITGINILIFLSFPLTAFTAYILFYKQGFGKFPSFIAGFIFGFSPAVVFQSIGSHSLNLNFFIPLLLIALFNHREKRTIKSSIYAGIAYLLLLITSFYLAYFSLFMIFLFILYDYKTSSIPFKVLAKNYIIIIGIPMIMIFPVEFYIIFEHFTKSAKDLLEIGKERSIQELYTYSSRSYEFHIPQVTHPVFGDFVKDFTRMRHPGTNLPEQTLYLGYTPMVFLFISFYYLEKKYFNSKDKTFYFIFLSGFFLMIFLSLPPTLKFFNIKIPNMSFFLYQIVPMYKIYSRSIILAMLFLGGITALMLNIMERIKSKRFYYAVCSIILISILFEYSHDTQKILLSRNQIPAVYTWLADDKNSKVIAEYPMFQYDDSITYSYLLYRKIHKKKLVTGARPGTEEWKFYRKVHDIYNQETLMNLKTIGTDYVIIHSDKYREGMIPKPLKSLVSTDLASHTYGEPPPLPFGLTLVKDFGETRVYRIKSGDPE